MIQKILRAVFTSDFGYIVTYVGIFASWNQDGLMSKIDALYPSYRSIGKAVGMSINTVRKYVKSLEDKLLITTMPTSIVTKRGNNQN